MPVKDKVGLLQEEWEVFGHWWLPGTESSPLFGQVAWTPLLGAVLHVYGEMIKLPDDSRDPIPEIERIDGVTTDEIPISLWGCSFSSGKHVGFDCREQTFSSAQVITGLNGGRDLLKFSRAILEFTCLGAWLRGYSTMASSFSRDGMRVTAGNAPEFILGYHDGLLFSLFMGASLSGDSAAHLISVSERHQVLVKAEERSSLDKFSSAEFDIKSLLAFATAYPVLCTSFMLAGGDAPPHSEVRFHWLQSGSGQEKADLTFLPYEAVIMPGSHDWLAEFIQAWLCLQEEKKDIIKRFGSLLYPNWQYQELEFLTIAFCLEEFHGLLFSSKANTDDEHNPRVSSILSVCPDPHRAWLSDQLKYSNEVRFRQKIRNILSLIPDDSRVKTSLGSVGNFINCLLNTRNYQVHHDPALARTALRGEQLHRMCEKMKMLMEYIALRQLGVASDRIDVELSRRWRHLIRR